MRTALYAYTLSECMEIAAQYVAAYEKQGARNVVFCEDRLTLIAERAITRHNGGSFNTSVTTFARFLRLEEKILSKQGSVMATGTVMTSLLREKKLRCFHSVEGIKRGAKNVYETLAQLSASQVNADTLRSSMELLPDGVLKNKLSDLAEIGSGYNAFLRENGFLDESGYLSLLPQRIREDEKTRGANIFFLCYDSFTLQALEAIRAACSCAKNVIGIFCGGKEEFYTNRARTAFTRTASEFGKTECRDLGTPLSGEAETLRKSLFDPEALATEKLVGGLKTDKIRLFETEDKNEEAELVASLIKKEIASGARYRDIAVLTADAAGYALAFKKAFEEYEIPYFFDVKKSLKNHPLSRFLLDCFAVARENFAPNSVQSLLSNVFFGESDEYRNYLLKHASFRGGAKREIRGEAFLGDFDRSVLVSAREKLLSAIEPIKTKALGREYCACVREILRRFDAQATLERLEAETEDIAVKSYLSQISDALDGVLAEAELLTGEKELSVAEFEAILGDGLDATEIALIPLKADAVFFGDITDSRIEKVKTLFAVGMTDAVPKTTEDTALVSDREIEMLVEVKTMIEPTVAEVNLRARESVALNLCTFTDKLYLSYSLSLGGEEPALSETLRYLSVFKNEQGEAIQAEKGLKKEEFPFSCAASAPAVRALIRKKQDFEAGRKNSKSEYDALFAALSEAGVSECSKYVEKDAGQVRIERGEELFFSKNGSVSPTAIEEYYRCPFSNFSSRGLFLREREESAAVAVDSGNFVHALLEQTGKEIGKLTTESQAREFVLQKGRELLASPIYTLQTDSASGKYAAECLLAEGVAAALAVWRQITCSTFEIESTEKVVSTSEFHGKADRVDATEKFVRVIDYKTGEIKDKPVDYYTGRKLQRQLYMSAVKGERIPAGVFYFPASVSFKKEGEINFRMSGYVNGDREAILAGDTTIEEGQESNFFHARLGDNSRLSSVMDEETFSDFLDYALHVTRKGTKELKDGFIAPTPYEGACTYCKYGGMCGFNYRSMPERKEDSLSPKEIAEISRRCREGEDKHE